MRIFIELCLIMGLIVCISSTLLYKDYADQANDESLELIVKNYELSNRVDSLNRELKTAKMLGHKMYYQISLQR